MTRFVAIVIAATLLVTACDRSTSEPGQSTLASTTSRPTTTTTIDPEQACRDVAEQLSGLFEDVLDELDELDPAVFADRSLWPEDLLALEATGVELDRAAAQSGCDPALLQAQAFDTARDRNPESLLSLWLLELLLSGDQAVPADAPADPGE